MQGNTLKSKGVVKFFKPEQAWGFVTSEDGKDYFLHIKNIKGFFIPERGQRVLFNTSEQPRGIVAVDVEPDVQGSH